MAAKVKLKEIVDALEMQFDEMPPFLNLDTGEVEYELPDEEDECEGDYLRLPTKRDVNEWGIMEEFASPEITGRATSCSMLSTDPGLSGTSRTPSAG